MNFEWKRENKKGEKSVNNEPCNLHHHILPKHEKDIIKILRHD